MNDNKKAKIPANSNSIRCRNCSLKLPSCGKQPKKKRSLQDATLFMKDVLKSWIAPTPVLPEDYLCKECFSILQELPEENGPPAPMLGNRCVCFGCGSSFLQTQARTLNPKSPLRNILIKHIPVHLIPRLTRVCNLCWHQALKEVRRKESMDSRRSEKQLLETNEIIPLEQLMVPVRVEAKPLRRSSSTESVDSEHLKKFVSEQKRKRSQKFNRTKDYSRKRLCPPQKNECETSFQYRYERLPAHTLMEIRRMIYRVYRYLHTEYKALKGDARLSGDISPLADVVTRTASATGVTHETVRKIVQERDKEFLKNKKPLKKARRDRSPTAEAVARDHCYYLSPPRQPTQHNTQRARVESCRPAPCRHTAQSTTASTERDCRTVPEQRLEPQWTGDIKQEVSDGFEELQLNPQNTTELLEGVKEKLILKFEAFDEGVQQTQFNVHHTPPDVEVEPAVKVEPVEHQYEQLVQEPPWNTSALQPPGWDGGRGPGSIVAVLLRPPEDYTPEVKTVQMTSVPANTFDGQCLPGGRQVLPSPRPRVHRVEPPNRCGYHRPPQHYTLEDTTVQVTSVAANNLEPSKAHHPSEQTRVQEPSTPANTYDMVYLKYVKDKWPNLIPGRAGNGRNRGPTRTPD